MHFPIRTLGPVLLVMLFAACTSPQKKSELDNQVKNEPAATPATIQQQVETKLIENPNLTASQQDRLRVLRDDTSSRYSKAQAEYRQTQSLLVKKLADPKSSIKEIGYLKQKMKKLGYKQTDIALNAVNKASEIVGKKTAMDEDFYQHFMTPEYQDPSNPMTVPR